VAHGGKHFMRRRRNVTRVARATSADPILRTPEFSGLLVAAPGVLKKNPVDLLDETERKRKALFESFESMDQRPDVIGNFLDVVDRNAGNGFVFKEKQV